MTNDEAPHRDEDGPRDGPMASPPAAFFGAEEHPSIPSIHRRSGGGGHHHHHPAPTPRMRSTLSSRASDMGRKLAVERSRSEALAERVRELEEVVASLQMKMRRGEEDNCTDDDDDDDDFAAPRGGVFSSPPVTTPTKRREILSDANGDVCRVGRRLHDDFDEALGSDEEARISHQASNGMSNGSDGPVQPTEITAAFDVVSDPFIEGLLKRASDLLAPDQPSDRSNDDDGGGGGGGGELTLTEVRMREYHELVTAFHSEQESHGDIDGEESVPREDVLWLFQELRWRFEDILAGHAREKRLMARTREGGEVRPRQGGDDVKDEWKEVLAGLVGVVRRGMQPAGRERPTERRGQQGSSTPGDARALEAEVESLNHRLASFAAQHNETCRSLYDDMDAMKRDYQEQIAAKARRVQDLETKIAEQEEHISSMASESQRERQAMDEERRRMSLSGEGSAARVRYLEGMLRALRLEAREARSPAKRRGRSRSGTPARARPGDDEPVDAEGGAGGVMSPPPVFLRNLPSEDADETEQDEKGEAASGSTAGSRRPMHDGMEDPKERDGGQPPTSDAADVLEAPRTNGESHPPPPDAGDEMAKLREQVASLGKSLEDSETRRANLLEGFQRERQQHMAKYKQMSDLLRQLVEAKKSDDT